MTRLEEALVALGVAGEVAYAGRWVRLQGERCAVYVTEATGGYYTWCDHPLARSVESYADAGEALQAGLRRASDPDQEVPPPNS